MNRPPVHGQTRSALMGGTSKGSTVKPQGLTLALKSLLAEQQDDSNQNNSRDVEKKHRKAIMSSRRDSTDPKQMSSLLITHSNKTGGNHGGSISLGNTMRQSPQQYNTCNNQQLAQRKVTTKTS